MTRDEQIKALVEWRDLWPPDAMRIVDNFPAFMEKCAEVGLCHKEDGDLSDWYTIRKTEPPHEHDLRITGLGTGLFGPHNGIVILGCTGCDETRDVPNNLPIMIPS